MAPVFGHAANLGRAGENVTIHNLGSIRAVEALDKRILCRLSWLDVRQFHAVPPGPVPQGDADELGAVAQAKVSWCAANVHQFIQSTDDPCQRQAGVDLDLHALAVEVVVDIEGPEAPARRSAPAMKSSDHVSLAAAGISSRSRAVRRRFLVRRSGLSLSAV
ncbi:hypothetical protein [Pseudoxanthomonas sp. 3HH-4]|uniref:hypothetical protein n=1 Tax=Pseudoxanthomonas sp. 3HH-4 TaxID=1690214 RepID=UPI001C8ABE34|nr:hypothetical protein [Pseudoxanthomonas sp. 3HH-4]